MAVVEASCLLRASGSSWISQNRNGAAPELAAFGVKNHLTRRGTRVVKFLAASTGGTCPSFRNVLSPSFPLHLLQATMPKISPQKLNELSKSRSRQICYAKSDGDKEDDNEFDENGRDKLGFNRAGRDKYGLDKDGLDKFGLPGDAILDGPIIEPEYNTYIDPNTREPAPTYGVRPPLPNAAFWGEDLEDIQKSSRNSASVESSTRDEVSLDYAASDSDTPPRRTARPGRRRKKNETSSSSSEPQDSRSDDLSEEELANIAHLRTLREKFRAEEEDGKYKSIAQVMKESEVEEQAEEKEHVQDEEEDVSLGKLMRSPGYPLVSRHVAGDNEGVAEVDKPLTNDELWWNWQKPPADKNPWSAWQKRAGDSDSVMAAAMAETGQIKLFGEKPTIAEATLARARKRVFYNERMAAEEARKNEIGAMAYYKEWVKAYKGDTSKEAVQRHYEETGEEVGIQLLNMFAYQTAEEYRIMQGTDVRIRRDPLTMRMRKEQIKQVWGGDPVYPTINYVQDPDSVADYRNENMHEPIPDILELLRESGRLKTQEEIKAILEQEKLEDDELGEYDELAGAIDIGDEDDEDENDDDEYEVDLEEKALSQTRRGNAATPKKSLPMDQATFSVNGAKLDVEDEVQDVTLLEDDDIDDET